MGAKRYLEIYVEIIYENLVAFYNGSIGFFQFHDNSLSVSVHLGGDVIFAYYRKSTKNYEKDAAA